MMVHLPIVLGCGMQIYTLFIKKLWQYVHSFISHYQVYCVSLFLFLSYMYMNMPITIVLVGQANYEDVANFIAVPSCMCECLLANLASSIVF